MTKQEHSEPRFELQRVEREWSPGYWILKDMLTGENYHFRGHKRPSDKEILLGEKYLQQKELPHDH
jgi:hypothetical protein